MSNHNILHLVRVIGKESFGIGQVSVSLAQAQCALNHNATIWCTDNNENVSWASETHSFPVERITSFKLSGWRNFYFSYDMYKQAIEIDPDLFDVVHQHGIWTGTSCATHKFRQKDKIPTIISPHGALNHWALNLSPWKKKIALAFYERNNLTQASCLHATSETEIADFRNFGLKNPIAYIANGIHEKYLSVEGNAEGFRMQYSISSGRRILFYLSRITPKKGILMLIEAIDTIRNAFSDWQLIIAGIDEYNHKADVQSLINYLKLEDRIKIIGPLFDQAKADAFAAAELFILPSYSEGFPMVVLDSLAAGVPVITTKASTWSDLQTYNCGWWTDISVQSIAVALREAVSISTEDLYQIGKNGKSLILSKYSWTQLAQKTIRLYDWLLEQGDKPDFVILD